MPAVVHTRRAVVGRLLVVAVAVALSVTMTNRAADSADTPLTVSGVDSLGFPYVDLVVAGVPGTTTSEPPAIAVSQFGQRVPTTSTWLLSDSQPLAVVTDASKADLAQVQGIVGELVQAMPPELPMSLVSTKTGRASSPSLNRDAFMVALQQQSGSTAEPISTGIAAAAAAGMQHVFVVTACSSPVPTELPIGVISDVIGVGPHCTAEWRSALTGRAGRFAAAADTTGALSAMDAMVAAWRSSVVVIAQVSTRQALQVSLGSQRTTVSIGGGEATQPATPRATSSSGSDRLLLVLGLLLLLLAVVLGAVWLARRRRHPEERAERDLDLEDDLERMVVARTREHPRNHPRDDHRDQQQDHQRDLRPAVHQAPAPRAEPPAVIDLRDRPAVAEQPVAIDAGLAPDEATIPPLMAVATPAAVGKAERPLPATVATRDIDEEPVAMAEEQVSNDVTDEARTEVASEEVSSEAAEPAVDEIEPDPAETAAEAKVEEPVEAQAEPDAEAAPETAPEAATEAAPEAEAEAQAEATAPAPPAPPAPPAGLAPTEFSWTPLQFSPLVWRYDAEQDATIDLREPAAVDIREKSGRRQPRRKKANR